LPPLGWNAATMARRTTGFKSAILRATKSVA
jgi:hypothetical protein